MEFWDDIEFFTAAEFDCRCGCGDNDMKHSFMLQLDDFRRKCNFPFRVTSGYRCPDYNNQVSSSGLNGPHTTGRAADIAVSGALAHKLLIAVHTAAFTGIGLDQKGDHASRFIHLDTLEGDQGRPRPTVWTY